MQSVAIYSPFSNVVPTFLSYLRQRKYKNIDINYNTSEVTATRRNTLLKKDRFFFKLIFVNEAVTHIDIMVNPKKTSSSQADLQKEIVLQEKLYACF